MKIEKINENKIRITLNIQDLMEKNIDFHTFMSNPIETQTLFAEMLETAEREVGFATKNCQLSIDAVATSEGDFIVTVTRCSDAPLKRKVHAKRKEIIVGTPVLIYSFSSFDDVISFCKYAKINLMQYKVVYDKYTSLYEYQDSYYIVFKNVLPDIDRVKDFCSSSSEFGKYVDNADLFESKLAEYGNKIVGKNVIQTINKKF